MKNSIHSTYLLFFCAVCLPVFSFFACNKTKSVHDGTVKWETTPWLEAFAHALPHDKPDVCMQLLEDSVKNIEDQQWLCTGIMFDAFGNQKHDVYMAHLDNFEGLAKGRFKVLGEPTETFAGKIAMFRGYKYRETLRYDSAFFFLNKSLKVFEALKDTTFICDALHRITNTY